MRKLISTLKWEATRKAVGILYASTDNELEKFIGDLELMDGSIAYTKDGDTYILDGKTWWKVM